MGIIKQQFVSREHPGAGVGVNFADAICRDLEQAFLFNEQAGTRVNNRAKKKNHGRVTAGGKRGAYLEGRGYVQNGAGEYIDCGAQSFLGAGNPMTFMFYGAAKSMGQSSAGRLYNMQAGAARNFTAQFVGTNALEFNYGGSTNLVVNSAANGIPLNKIISLLITWTGSTTASTVHMYVDGKELGYVAQTNGATLDTVAGQTLYIANRRTDFARAWDGIWLASAFWSRVLEIDEIEELSYNPYLLFERKKRAIFFPPSVAAADSKTASLTQALIRIIANTTTASRNDTKSASLTKATISIIAGVLSASRQDAKTATLTQAVVRFIANATSASIGVVIENKTASLTKQTISIIANALSASRNDTKTATLTQAIVRIITNNLIASRNDLKAATLSKALVSIVTNSLSASKTQIKTANLQVGTIRIIVNSPTVSRIDPKSASLTTAQIRIILNSLTATIPGAGVLEINILLRSQLETTINRASRIETILNQGSRMQTQIYGKSDIDTSLNLPSKMETLILGESALDYE